MHVKETISDRIQTVRDDATRLDSILYERKSSNFEIDELRQLGIHTAQVELAEEEQVLKFEPCFFWPDFPPFSLSDYPIRKDDEVYQDITGGEDPDESDSEWESSHYDGFDTDRLIYMHYDVSRDGFDDDDYDEDGHMRFSDLESFDFKCVHGLCVPVIIKDLTDYFLFEK